MDTLASLIGQSSGMVAIHAHVRRLLSLVATARRVPPVLLQGETGTGKSLLARALHAASPRAKAPFVSVNCAAIPETLLEAELFGFERGAFTDARQSKPGLFQEAHGGTLFLDEVGLLPESPQAKLLTALDERAVRRLGSTRTEPTDCWIIAATSADLEQARRKRRFREDLYHRLSVFTICLPPLRERGDDVLQLAEVLLARVCADYGLPSRTLDRDARNALAGYSWPGNVRELGNVLERAALLSETSLISAYMLGIPSEARELVLEVGDASGPSSDLRQSLDDLERARLLEALDQAHWNVALAAEILGMPRNTLRYRIEKHGLTRPDRPVPRATVRLRERRDRRAAGGPGPSRPDPEELAAPGVADRAPRRRAISFLRVSLAGTLPPAWVATQGMRVIAEKTEAFGGRILQHSDGEMDVAFGLEPTEDAPARAASAALAIRRLIDRTETEYPDIRLRLTIETLNGFVVETPHGETRLTPEFLQEAQRALAGLSDRTEHGLAVVGPGAAPYLERKFSLTTHEAHGEPTATLLLRRDPVEGRRGRAPDLWRTPFVGRGQELAFLEHRWNRVASTGRGHVVGLMGEAGIGKSRLLIELRRRLSGHGALILEGHCASHSATLPYSLLINLMRRECRLDDRPTPTDLSAAVASHLAAVDLPDCIQEIGSLLGLPAEALTALSPAAVKCRIFDAFRRLLLAHARWGTLVLLLEDLHWGDQTSQEFLGLLVDGLPGAPVLVVATTRSGYRAAWLDRSWASQLALLPLSPDDSREMLRALRPELDPARADAIAHRAEGNPFFLEELVGVLGAGTAIAVPIPGTVTDALHARMDRLPAATRRVLESAAVVGREVPIDLLVGVTGTPVDPLVDPLGHLIAAEFLFEQGRATLAFRHALMQEVAYTRLPEAEREQLHAAALAALERLDAGGLDEHLDRLSQLAHHAYRAGHWEKAVGYLRRAASAALDRSAAKEAVECLERALDALAHLPASPDRSTTEIDTRVELRTALFQLGRHDATVEHLAEAEVLAELLGDDGRLGWIHVYWAYYFGAEGDDTRSEAAALTALASATKSGDRRLEHTTTFHLAQLYARTAQYARAATLNQQLVDAGASSNAGGVEIGSAQLVIARLWLLWCLAEVGSFDEGLRRAEAMTRAANEPFDRLAVLLGQGLLYLRQGRLAEATSTLEDALPLCRTSNLGAWFPAIASPLGYAYALSGRLADGLPLLEQAVEATAQRGAVHALRVAHLAEAHLLAGDAPKACHLATQALEAARKRGERAHEAYALRVLGRVAAKTGLTEAEQHLRAAVDLADELGMRPLAAQARLDLTVVHDQQGGIADREATATEAMQLLESMAMRPWLARQT
jgi:DNA-binding NtrC family response regulator/tetratricopeptide (TPR) repeat protein